ncbi:agamous-like MADS-box protein AGL18 [Primulina tabacum]|uniref:agamous-like MADS-box protein AGL18 n=1 Tax=Primulina tabacum TaxID=48773 RepID=UPI003F59F74F
MASEKMDSAEKITEGKSSSGIKSAFIKRRDCLIKKASELAILCGSEVAIIGYSNDGKLFEYASSEYALYAAIFVSENSFSVVSLGFIHVMAKIMKRFEECQRIKKGVPVNHDPERQEDVLREEMEKLKQKEDQHVLGRNLDSMSREDLQELEQQLNEGLLCIKDRKEAILVQKLQKSRDNELQSMQENVTLRQKVENLERLCAPISYQQPILLEYQLKGQSNFELGQGVASPQLACDTSTGDADLVDTNLQLGPSTSKVCGKRKTPCEERRSNADTFLSI